MQAHLIQQEDLCGHSTMEWSNLASQYRLGQPVEQKKKNLWNMTRDTPHHEDVEGLGDVQAHVAQQGVCDWFCVQLIAVQLPDGAVARTEIRRDPAEVLDPYVGREQAVHAEQQTWMVHFLPV